ncbi:hypothetical protein LUW76_29525 [Actinomadura madurae]|uniref:hypothetical protein n=1 Tax=Actinomadura madurae TaxID=1993 RepID=UPI00202700F6|nr:hypothetical protein [Actinomadura madurae]URM98174.1 hypothetical protein LUW76_29525 [Actinomadura madurae]
MARYRYDAKVEAFPRDLLDEVVAALLDAVEGAPVTESGFAFGEDVHDEVRLVEGRHVATGARYRIAVDRGEGEVSVVAWNRAGESRIDVTGDFGGHIVRLCVELRMSGRRLQTVRVSGDYQGPKPFRMVRRAKWECEMQAEEWWAVLGSKTAPLSVRVAHPFAFADLRIARGKDKGGRWAVRTTARFGGRSLLRPLAWVGLAVMRRRVRRMLDEGFGNAVSAWNTEVPGMAKRGLRERLGFEHRVTLTAVSREWAEAYVAALHQAVGELRFKKGRLVTSSEAAFGVRLLKGAHIGPGARYRIAPVPEDEIEPLDVDVVAWDRAGANRIEFSTPGDVQTGWVEIDSARKPTVVRAALAGEVEGFTQAECEGELDLGRWWTDADEGPALTANAANPLGEAALTVKRTPAVNGRWTVTIAATVEGRAWTRRLIAVAGLFGAASMNRSLQETADAAALKWDGLAARSTELSPREAADETLRMRGGA